MKNLLELLNTFGIQIDSSAPPVVFLSLCYLIISILCLLNVVNICIYLLSVYIFSHEKILSQIKNNYLLL